ncbi:MAG TPA: FlgD immunoglobulin-like domain containing protein [Elusimicrobiales bacterium]|nr:FlgD immunoglobulin-like domain containing protein [Elusimicrobiales bacterium]
MHKGLSFFAAILVFGSTTAIAGDSALSQLPQDKQEITQPSAPAMKAVSARLDFRISNYSRSGFSLGDFTQNVQISGYRDFDGDFSFSGWVDQANFTGSLTRNQLSQDFTYEAGATKLLVKRYTINYKVTGSFAGANGAVTPVNLLIKGGIRGQRYAVSEAGLELLSSRDGITGTVDAAADNKQYVATIVSIMAALQGDAVFGVVETAGNYPNPFQQGNGTTLTYTLIQPADQVHITVYNAYGKVLKEMDGNTAKGENQVFWDGRSDYNDNFMGQKLLIWQLEIYFRGSSDKVIKQFTMNAR